MPSDAATRGVEAKAARLAQLLTLVVHIRIKKKFEANRKWKIASIQDALLHFPLRSLLHQNPGAREGLLRESLTRGEGRKSCL